MPHLSPMLWMCVMLLMWAVVMSLMVTKFRGTPQYFYTSQMTKSLKTTNTWNWPLQGGRD